jgi:hypothetical protein
MTPEEKESVNKLAENLKKQGMASNISDAIRQAKQMLGIDDVLPKAKTAQDIINSSEELPPEPEKPKDEQKELEEDFDVTKSEKTVKELITEEEKDNEEVEEIKEEAEQIEKEEEKIEQEEEKDEKEIEKVEEQVEQEKEEEKEIEENIEKEEKREEQQGKAEAKTLTDKEKEDTNLANIFNVNK